MSALVTRAQRWRRVAASSDRIRFVVLTAYYLAILIGVVAVRSTHVPATRFVYQAF